jgi:hypothetical protein
MKPEYIQILTPAERAAAVKLGMASVLAHNRVQTKSAQWPNIFTPSGGAHAVTSGLKNTAAFIAAASLLAGTPIGAVAHVMGRKVKGNQRDEKERLDRIQYYRDITKQLETGLAR